jgi:uridine kinase
MSKRKNITHIVKRDGRIVPFDRKKIINSIYRSAAAVGGHEIDLSRKLADEAVDIINDCYQAPDMPIVNEIQDIVEKVLIENGHAKTAKALILYREYRRRERLEKEQRGQGDTRLPYRIMYESLAWNIEQNCETIEKLNNIIRSGELNQLVRASENTFNQSIRQVAEEIAKEKEGIKLIIVAGPSSSGKTTTTAKLAKWLNLLGMETVPLNLDHYFFDLKVHPKDEHGDYDFETPEALDITLIDAHLHRLIKGDTIKMPHYDFSSGIRTDDVTPVSISPNQVLLIDTLHGLFEPLTQSIADNEKIKVYIETISQIKDKSGRFIRWTDIRLLRRMVRDNASRGYEPDQTIGHWHYVRKSEMKHIIPFNRTADFKLNGALPYELPYLKKYTYSYFPQFIEKWRNDSSRRDAYIRADRIFEFLSQVEDFDDEKFIPEDSLLREFIGGSTLKLH